MTPLARLKWLESLASIPTMTASMYRVAVALSSRMNCESGACHPSLNTLSRDAGTPRRSTIRAIQALSSVGAITIQKRYNSDSLPANYYTLNTLQTSDTGDTTLGVLTGDTHDTSLQPQTGDTGDTSLESKLVPPVALVPSVTLPHLGSVTRGTKLVTPVAPEHGNEQGKDIYNVRTQNSGESEEKKPKRRSKKKFTPDDLKIAEKFFSLILEIHHRHKPPNLDDWSNTIRLIRERDGYSHDEISDMIEWTHRHDFWRTNILSPAKLREKWDQLTIQRATNENRRANPHSPVSNAARRNEIHRQVNERLYREAVAAEVDSGADRETETPVHEPVDSSGRRGSDADRSDSPGMVGSVVRLYR